MRTAKARTRGCGRRWIRGISFSFFATVASSPALGQDKAPWLSAPQAPQDSALAKPAWSEAAAAALPVAAPWLAGGLLTPHPSTGPAKIALERDWSWQRLARDLELIGRVRDGLGLELREFRRQREHLLVRDTRTGELLPDHQDFLRSSWRRVADRLLALDSIIVRYRTFDGIVDPELRAGAFLGAYAAFAAQTRFARDWIAEAGEAPMAKLLDTPLLDLGLKQGSFSSLRQAMLGSRAEALRDAKAYAAHGFERPGTELQFPGARGLLKAGKAAGFALAGLKSDTRTVKAPPQRKVVPVPIFEPWQRAVTTAAVWAESELKPQVKAAPTDTAPISWLGASVGPALSFAQPWQPVLVSTVAVPAEEWMITKIVRMLLERPSLKRPAVLISSEKLSSMAERLEPGDILLLRRELYIEEPGLGGWWTGAAIYVGTPEERERLMRSTELDSEINSVAPEAYWRSLKTEGGHRLRVVVAAPGGVRLASIESGMAADSLAALRPRLPLAKRARAALRAFQAVGRPYDAAFDASDPSALYSAELLVWAYGETPLRLEPRPADAAGPVAPDDFARTFDFEFGTPRMSFDLIGFLDGREQDRKAAWRGPEQFRLSWKRPRWRFEENVAAKPEGE